MKPFLAFILLISCCTIRHTTYAQTTVPATQLTITQPLENQIVQRDLSEQGLIYITGYYKNPVKKVEARLMPEQTHDEGIQWKLLSTDGFSGMFTGSITGQTGWYQLQVKATLLDDNTIIESVKRVGIGEVFVIGGASNSMGMPNHGAKGASNNVMSFNKVNKTLSKEGVTIVKYQPYDLPIFSQFEAENLAYPTGESAWLWGELGDKIMHKTGAPVLFFNVGWAAANSADYRTNIEGKDAYNFYIGQYWPNRQPYHNLLNTLRYYTSWLGARSFLWAHGETDAEYTNHTQKQYVDNITLLINESRLVSGQNLHWTIAVGGASLGSAQARHPITHAQIELGTTRGLNTSLGPNTDTIQVPRFDGHFSNIVGGIQGLSLAAEAWSRNMDSQYFKTVQPFLPKGTIHTGIIPAKAFPTASFPVPYYLEGNLSKDSRFHVELLKQDGSFLTIIGEGYDNPLWVTLPKELPSDQYRLRMVATNPFYSIGSTSEVFTVDSTLTSIAYLRNFNIQPEEQHITIQWLHTAHPDIQEQILQKSTNTFDYIDIARFDGRSNQNSARMYYHQDTKNTETITYYRVKSVFANEVVYSQAIPYYTGTFPEALTLFPNPVNRDYFLVMAPDDLFYTYELYDQNGSRQTISVNTNAIEGMTAILLSPSIVNGVYHLRIKNKEYSYSKKILVQR